MSVVMSHHVQICMEGASRDSFLCAHSVHREHKRHQNLLHLPNFIFRTQFEEWVNIKFCTRSEVFTAVMIHYEVSWVVTLCSAVVRCQHFRGYCFLHLQGKDLSQGLLSYDAAQHWGKIPMFWRTMLPPSSGQSEDGKSIFLWNAGNLPQHYMESQAR
jgi:hypothetical protein